eukprot:jgi/Tetstr1/420991/TSEL_012051.t1
MLLRPSAGRQMAEEQGPLQLVLRELQELKEENAHLRRDMGFGIRRLEQQVSGVEREVQRSKPSLASATNQRLDAMLHGASGHRQAQAWGADTLSDTHRSSSRESELSVILRQLSTSCGRPGARAIAEAAESEDGPLLKKSMSAASVERKHSVSSHAIPESGLSHTGRRMSTEKERRGTNTSTFFRDNFGAAERDPDRPLDGDEDGDDEGPKGCWEASKAIVTTPIHPLSPFRTRWDLFVLLLLMYVCITAPVIVCFDVEIVAGEHNIWYFEQFVTIMFVIDIIFNLNTSYIRADDELVTSRGQIAWNYAKTWLIIDAVAVIPYELLTPNQEVEAAQLAKGLRLAKFTRILRVLRVVKLLRILKVPALLRRIEGVTGRGALRSVLVMGGAILICHLAACGFFYAALIKMQDNLDKQVIFREANNLTPIDELTREEQDEIGASLWEETWVMSSGLAGAEHSTSSRYITALYWSMSTLTTVGYGDVTPANNAEKLVSMIAMVLGVTIFAYFMGSSASMIAAMNSGETMVTRKLSQMDEFLRQRRVPQELTEKIRKFYNLAVQHQVVEDDHMVNQLSLPLKTELLLFLYRGTLERGQDPQFITSLVAKLRMEYYAEGDIVVQEGDLGSIMYFVVSGVLEARQYNFDVRPAVPDQLLLLLRPDTRDCVPPMKSKFADSSAATPSFVKRLKDVKKRFRKTKVSQQEEAEQEYSQIPQQWKFFSNVRDLRLEFSSIGRLHMGEHFGEYSCLLGHPRTSTVVSLDFSELYSLSRDDLMEVYRQWPELHKEFLELVKQFQEITGVAPDSPSRSSEDVSVPAPDAQQRRSLQMERELFGPGTRRNSTTREISAAVATYHESSADISQDNFSVDSSEESQRTKGQKGMKKAVKLMMNMQQFDKLSTNPVFKLLNSGHDLKGMLKKSESSVHRAGSSVHAPSGDLPPLQEELMSSRPRAKSMFENEHLEDAAMKGKPSLHKSISTANTQQHEFDPESPPLPARYPEARDPHVVPGEP